jgi:hypothetical protein
MHIKNTAITWFIILFILTSLMVVLVPPTPSIVHTLHLTDISYRFIMFTLLLPYGIIWFTAFYGYDQLERYVRLLVGTTEGRAFKKIANGLKISAWGLIIGTLLTLVLRIIALKIHHMDEWQAIINHYFTLIVALVSFSFMGDGAYMLSGFVETRPTKTATRWVIIIAIVIGAFFVRLVLHNHNVNDNPYYLGIYPLLITIVIPYLYTWAVGGLAIIDIRLYAQKIKGVLYRRALNVLAGGITVVLAIGIVVQYITAAFVANSSVELGPLLALVYGLLAIYAVGFGLVALGAQRLKKIEEI